VQRAAPLDVAVEQPANGKVEGVARRNVEYIAQLHALLAWYREVRLVRVANDDLTSRLVLHEAIANIELGIGERLKRFGSYLAERGQRLPALAPVEQPPCPLELGGSVAAVDHVTWVQALASPEVDALAGWLDTIVANVRTRLGE
jgi:UDP-N-acetylglucosamine/UDP-N-acetylgalactosamine diphosphorylase